MCRPADGKELNCYLSLTDCERLIKDLTTTVEVLRKRFEPETQETIEWHIIERNDRDHIVTGLPTKDDMGLLLIKVRSLSHEVTVDRLIELDNGLELANRYWDDVYAWAHLPTGAYLIK